MDGLRLQKKLNIISLFPQTRDVFTFFQRSCPCSEAINRRAVVIIVFFKFIVITSKLSEATKSAKICTAGTTFRRRVHSRKLNYLKGTSTRLSKPTIPFTFSVR